MGSEERAHREEEKNLKRSAGRKPAEETKKMRRKKAAQYGVINAEKKGHPGDPPQ